MFGWQGGGSGSSSSSGVLPEPFVATAGQTDFATSLTLTADSIGFRQGVLLFTGEYSIAGNTFKVTVPCEAGEQIVVVQ